MIAMEKHKDLLLTLCAKAERLTRKNTNRWRIRTFNALAACTYVKWNEEDDIQMDALLRNNAARIAY